jgi:hypothetical protein
MSDKIAGTMNVVVLLPHEAMLPDAARRRLWECSGSVRLVSEPVEALAELASCRQPRAMMIINSHTWPEAEALQQAIARYWPDAHVEVVNEGEPQRSAPADALLYQRLNAMLVFLARPVAAMSRRGRAAITALAIALLAMTPIIWLFVLMRG